MVEESVPIDKLEEWGLGTESTSVSFLSESPSAHVKSGTLFEVSSIWDSCSESCSFSCTDILPSCDRFLVKGFRNFKYGAK